jgi:hypothetical protein
MRRYVLRLTFLVVAWTATSQPLAAQAPMTSAEPWVSIGCAAPMAWNTDFEVESGKITAVPALSGDFSVGIARRVRFHVAGELPAESEVSIRHVGSAGYMTTYRRREVPLLTLLGFRMHPTGRVQPVGLIGGGPVLWRTGKTLQRPSFFPPFIPPPPEITQIKDWAWALAGGFEVEIAISPHMAIVAGSRYCRQQVMPPCVGALPLTPLKGSSGFRRASPASPRRVVSLAPSAPASRALPQSLV